MKTNALNDAACMLGVEIDSRIDDLDIDGDCQSIHIETDARSLCRAAIDNQGLSMHYHPDINGEAYLWWATRDKPTINLYAKVV